MNHKPRLVQLFLLCLGVCMLACTDPEGQPLESSPRSLPTPIYGGDPDNLSTHVGALINATTNLSFCTATIIAPNWIVTAAHCLDNHTTSDTLFTNAADDAILNATTYGITQIIIHPDYRPLSFTSDIALLELDTSVVDVVPAELNEALNEEQIREVPPVFVGYGYDEQRDRGNRKAAAIPVKTIGNATFSSEYDEDYQTAACFGDSGGAVFTAESDRRLLIGVISNIINTSNTDPCIGTYNVTRIDTYIPWITHNAELEQIRCDNNSSHCVCPEACMPTGECNDRACRQISCEEAYDCSTTCGPANGACANDCYMTTLWSELNTFEAFMLCGESHCSTADEGIGLFNCLFAHCYDTFHDCFDATDCSLLGGDCDETHACIPGRFGLTRCAETTGLTEGEFCDPKANMPPCADGLSCEENGNDVICVRICESDADCTEGRCRTDDFALPGTNGFSVCTYALPHAISSGCSASPRPLAPNSLFTLLDVIN